MSPDATTVMVGIDVGTTGVKAIAVGPDGQIIARAEHGYPLSTPRPGWSEQNPEDWWSATRATIADLGSLEIAGIGLSGQMHGLVALDAAGQIVRPAILWNDQRTAAECAEIEERIGLARLISLTGNRALTGFTAPKLLWLRRHEPEAYARIVRIMLPKDYVRLRLTGEWATDVADASGTLLLDVAHRRWSTEVLDALDLDPAILPPLLESPEVSGTTIACDDVSQGIPVAAGAGDCAAAALGVGIDRPGPLSIVMGTSGVVFAALPAFASDREARVHAFCHAVPGQWHAMGVMLSAAGSLQWLRDRLAPETSFADLVAEAETWEPGTDGLLFAPYLAGERTPHADPSARAAFTGLELRHDRGALVRAVLEGVAFGLRDSLELVRELGGPCDRARASGGGARGLWLRIVASALGVPIELTAFEEGSAFGAALLGNPLPNTMHSEWSIRAIEAGKHVLCEKPFSRHIGDVEAAFDAADRTGLHLSEAFMYRHHQQTARLAELVAGGAIGDLRVIRTAFSYSLYDAENIRLRTDVDGGALMDVGCYCISGARLLGGEPESVVGSAQIGSSGTDWVFSGLMRFPGDVTALFDCGTSLPDRDELEAIGTDGSIFLDDPWHCQNPVIELRRDGAVERIEVGAANPYRLELEDMNAAIRGERAPLLGRADALGQVRTIDALFRSAAERQVVEP